jgi:hypothetical protein
VYSPATALMRRGCVHAILEYPARIRYCGICVDFPHPVSPAIRGLHSSTLSLDLRYIKPLSRV